LPSFFSGVLCRATALDNEETLRWKQRFAAIAAELRGSTAPRSAHQVLQALARALDLPSLTSRVFLNRSNARAAVRSIDAFVHFAAQAGEVSIETFLHELAARQKAVGAKVNYLTRRAQLELSTIHHAKGKEWPHVAIAYLEHGRFPQSADLAEERRLLYVAVTRASEALTLFEPSQAERRSVLSGELGRRVAAPSREASSALPG
jgi:DNA helicase-2/ATP-dependent DNA helicase PcrA